MSGETTGADSDLVAELQSAHRAYERAQEKAERAAPDDLAAVAERYDELLALFDEYEEEATGDGDFATFIEFQEEMARFVEGLPEEFPYRERFEEVDDLMQQRRLVESDFAEAREVIAPIADDAALVEERAATRSRYEQLRSRARKRIRELDERIADLEDLQALGEADLEAPTEQLREPITAYNDAVGTAFREFKREESARAVLGFVADTTAFPLASFREPPADIVEYVETHDTGTESITRLLELADYSRSKLDHYVDDPVALKESVGARSTYLRRLDADPLRIAWPPPPAERLRWQVRELVQVTGRFAPEDVVARLRDLRDLTDDRAWYRRLRRSARAREQLTDDQRERLTSGAVAEDLADARAERDRLADLLEELPQP